MKEVETVGHGIPPAANGMESEAEQIRGEIHRNMPLYHDDPDPNVLVDEDPGAPNGMFGDHQDNYDIG